MPMRWIVAVVSIALVALGEAPAIGQTPKPGGMLTLRLREDLPQGFSINESPTISTMWPAMPCFSNLVLFDPAKPTHSADTIIGELAERWAWEENYRKLVLALRGDVTWHDGRPFSATDVKYPSYFVKGRPYLDGLRYLIIAERSTAMAALQTGRVDVAFPGETPKPIAEQLKKGTPQLVSTSVNTSVIDLLMINTRKPPFDDVKVREAVNRAVDRRSVVKAVYQGGAVLGAGMLPRPYGFWGLVEGDLSSLAGYGRPDDEKAKARALLGAAGFGPARPLRVEMLTRGLPAFTDLASFVVGELKRVGIDATLRQVESSQWFPLQTRGEFHIGTDRNGMEPDDPDAVFYESFGCKSPRNYSGYCSEALTRLIDQQSQELDAQKRLALVLEIQRKIEQAAVRPVLVWRLDYFTTWPHVKGLVPHHSIYGWGRMQDVWRDK